MKNKIIEFQFKNKNLLADIQTCKNICEDRV